VLVTVPVDRADGLLIFLTEKPADSGLFRLHA
jgi:hypothetical protein